jgi:hypothetical protein
VDFADVSAGWAALGQLGLGHVDRALMVNDQHLEEHPVERGAARHPRHLTLPHAVPAAHRPHPAGVGRGRGAPRGEQTAHLLDLRTLRGLDPDSEILHLG